MGPITLSGEERIRLREWCHNARGAGAGARGTRHGTLAREKKSLGELGSVWERLAGAKMAAEETRMAAATIPHLLPPAARVFPAGRPYDLWETWLAGATVIRRSRNRELS